MTVDSTPQTPRAAFGLLQASAMNMSNMVGVGPFLTIPLILASMGGPQAMLGWILGALVAACDGMVWAELASAVPLSGGSFEYLKAGFAGTRFGRLLPFLFIWQFILSGPLEIASGTIGFAQYLTYLVPMDSRYVQWLAAGVGAITVLLLYRRIESVGRLMVTLWVGVLLTLAAVLIPGLLHFNAAAAFDFPAGAFRFSQGFVLGLGSAVLLTMYDFLGYYSVCYIGDEVKQPSRTIPRSILIAVLVVAAVYMAMNIAIISVVPWREAMASKYIASVFMERLYGPVGGAVITVMICWTAFASVFALMLGYSRIPYAAARDGFFFSVFARLHPRGNFPHVSLLVLGAVTVVAGFFPLEAVITALISTRILVQFIAQIGALAMLRRRPSGVATFRMICYPWPALIALAGWVYIFTTSGIQYVAWGLLSLAAGVACYFAWCRFARSGAASGGETGTGTDAASPFFGRKANRGDGASPRPSSTEDSRGRGAREPLPAPRVVSETSMTAEEDAAIRTALCLCFPADREVFSQTRAWHGSRPAWSVLAEHQGRVLAHVGVVARVIQIGAERVRAAGVQNACVVPQRRGTGLLRQIMAIAMDEARCRGLAVGVLFCTADLAEVYARLGWQLCDGRNVIRTDENGLAGLLPAKNVTMLYPLCEADIPPGDIHLLGNDW
ncbi:MAG: amino acid permease [Pirellulales bacterium]